MAKREKKRVRDKHWELLRLGFVGSDGEPKNLINSSGTNRNDSMTEENIISICSELWKRGENKSS